MITMLLSKFAERTYTKCMEIQTHPFKATNFLKFIDVVATYRVGLCKIG